jgi:serine protease Do
MGVGAYGMYYYMENYYKGNETTTIKKDVIVNDNGISDGIENIYDAVVVVKNYQKSKLAGIGSGFIYDENGYIMTNHHVVDKASEIKIMLMSGETISAKIVGSDEYADIGIIKIDKSYVKSVAKIGSSEKAKVGDTVFTIGSPMSADYAGTVTRGILSGKDRMVEVSVNSSTNDWVMNVMQTDAAINPGNSGGPLCNVSGEVIGINSMKIVQSEIEGIGFAIPIEEAMSYAKQIVNGIKVKRPLLGISMGDIGTSTYLLRREGITIDSSITSGVVVFSVSENGPAYKGGLLKGDVITKIGSYSVSNSARLKYYLSKYKPGDTIDVHIIRGNEEKKLKVTLGESE